MSGIIERVAIAGHSVYGIISRKKLKLRYNENMNQEPSMNNLSTADDAPGANPMPQATEQATTITPTPESTPTPTPEPVAPKAASKKPISTVKDVTRNLIGNYLGMYVIFNIGYSILYNTLLTKIESTIVLAIVALVIQAIIVFLSWKLGTSFTFRAKSIQREDVQKVMKILLIFTLD